DSESLEVLTQTKVPTTHDSDSGVAAGIVQASSDLINELSVNADDVVFIAHGTTQATNALLEGDVAKVGIIGLGQGLKGRRGKSETSIDDIELNDEQHIKTEHGFVNTSNGIPNDEISDILNRFKETDISAVVASQVFGVDDPTAEDAVCDIAKAHDIQAIGANVVSKRYGLKVRTRTAVVNASILPRMIATSRSTAEIGRAHV